MDKPLSNYLDEFGEAAKQAQDIARNLGLGAIAAVWIFKNKDDAVTLLPSPLIWALLLAVMGLGLDLVQYIVKAVWLYAFYRVHENQADALAAQEYAAAIAQNLDVDTATERSVKARERQTRDVHAPPKMEWVTWSFFTLKMLLMLGAYVALANFLRTKL